MATSAKGCELDEALALDGIDGHDPIKSSELVNKAVTAPVMMKQGRSENLLKTESTSPLMRLPAELRIVIFRNLIQEERRGSQTFLDNALRQRQQGRVKPPQARLMEALRGGQKIVSKVNTLHFEDWDRLRYSGWKTFCLFRDCARSSILSTIRNIHIYSSWSIWRRRLVQYWAVSEEAKELAMDSVRVVARLNHTS